MSRSYALSLLFVFFSAVFLHQNAPAEEISPSNENAIPEDTRSRRKRLDDLLADLANTPGHLQFNGGLTTVGQYLVHDGHNEAAGTGSIDIYAHTSYGPGTMLFFAFESGSGIGVDDALSLSSPLNGDAVVTRSSEGMDLLVLNEAWAEFTALNEAVTLTVGKIDLTNYFDINRLANDETSQFLSGAFINNAAFLAPDPGPGIRARTVLFDWFSAQVGVISSSPDGGTRFRDAFPIGELGMQFLPNSHLAGNIRAYLYAPAHTEGATGWGLSLDQNLTTRSAMFARWGQNSGRLAQENNLESAWSAGFQQKASLKSKELILGLAYGQTQEETGAKEKNFEIYSSWQYNEWTFISPFVQWVHNLERMNQGATVAGMRVQFFF